MNLRTKLACGILLLFFAGFLVVAPRYFALVIVALAVMAACWVFVWACEEIQEWVKERLGREVA